MSIGYASSPAPSPYARNSSALADMHRIGRDDLRVMLVVAESGSFRGGTAIAGVSLITARSAVARLERVYRLPLFSRLFGGASLTERGEELAAAASEMRNAQCDSAYIAMKR